METVRDRLNRAQASGNLGEIRQALLDAEASGVDRAEIERAMAEVEKLTLAAGKLTLPPGDEPGAAPGANVGEASDSAADGDGTAAPVSLEEMAEMCARAEAHKKRGNERLKESTKSAAREALECFSAGLAVGCSDCVLNAQLYSNRAHVRMLLRLFVEAVDDCRKAIELDPKNIKSYFRAAKASMQLDLCRNAIDFCEAGLQHVPNDADLKRLRDACADKLTGLQKRKSELSTMRPDFNADEAMAVQERVSNLGEQIEQLTSSIILKQRERLKANLTRVSLNELPDTQRVYESVGRCFLVNDRSALEQVMTSTIEKIEAELPKMSKTLEELEKRKNAAETELKEIINAFKQQPGAN